MDLANGFWNFLPTNGHESSRMVRVGIWLIFVSGFLGRLCLDDRVVGSGCGESRDKLGARSLGDGGFGGASVAEVEGGHADGEAVGDLLEDDGLGGVGEV